MNMEPINLKKLASLLHLSISTVSKALRDSHEISADTKKRVMDLARELNYEPNPYAGSLRKFKSKTIAVVVPDIINNFFIFAIKGIQETAHAKGYHVLIYITNEDPEYEKDVVRHMTNGRVDGVVISLTSPIDDTDHLKHLQEKGVPVVFFDRVAEGFNTSIITTNNYASAYNGTRYLIEQGCKRIAHCQVSDKISIGIDRLAGYKKALEDAGIAVRPEWILTSDKNYEHDTTLIEKTLLQKNAPDGLFTSVETHALIAYDVCRKHGIDMPGKLKLLSFSNMPTAHLLKPSLSTITQPAFEIGQAAVQQLIQVLEKPSRYAPETINMDSVLIKRESTGK
ncbi:LacI family DNA-binding transcriptional regulator [Niabella drilacis]|uniref:Transcriptional regulator, LacI family n=1 Tax=Niabella drilacis (strain DSM 25811 / CCM 8410 / CCUG 62505 / LMG 26954 / E90) TaxID=1285928 RepID=A0A1G6L803_NIADE|nr:LacI family DNA-binding transcriptional regulator [Niabella drilacis]SDC38885.1 transcriptional regulator, LacI family [Niabella drilacis]